MRNSCLLSTKSVNNPVDSFVQATSAHENRSRPKIEHIGLCCVCHNVSFLVTCEALSNKRDTAQCLPPMTTSLIFLA